MNEYGLIDAINGQSRPLLALSDEWLSKVRQRRGSISIENAKIASDSGNAEEQSEDELGIAGIDTSVDKIIGGIRDFYNALALARKGDMTEQERKIIDKVTNLLDTAVAPYVADIVKELDKLEGE